MTWSLDRVDNHIEFQNYASPRLDGSDLKTVDGKKFNFHLPLTILPNSLLTSHFLNPSKTTKVINTTDQKGHQV
jgi:hypothetical protein